MSTDAADPGPDPTPELVRWRLAVRYDGRGFSGWATQPGTRTVQGELEHWLNRVLRLHEPVRVVCAGRTDAGVHARGQVVHVDLPRDAASDHDMLIRRLRRALPDDLAVVAAQPAPPDFDARFGAIWRRYCYRIADGETQPDPLLRHEVLRVPHTLDLEAINAAARDLVGLRDFAAFCRSRAGSTTIRTLLELSAARVAGGHLAGVIEFTLRADAFCHSMVRSVVGGLVEVGSGRRDREWIAELARATERRAGVPVLPALGLTLEEVGYPPDDRLADRVRAAHARRELPDD